MARVTKKYYSVYRNGRIVERFETLSGAVSYKHALVKELMKRQNIGDINRAEREFEIREEIYNVEERKTLAGNGSYYWSKDWDNDWKK